MKKSTGESGKSGKTFAISAISANAFFVFAPSGLYPGTLKRLYVLIYSLTILYSLTRVSAMRKQTKPKG